MARKIVVNKNVIDKALRNSSTHCAIGEAIHEQIPSAIRVRVDLQTIRYTDRRTQNRHIFLTSPKAQNYIVAFDAGDTIKPFSFWLDSHSSQVINYGPMPESDRKRLAKINLRKLRKSNGHKGGKPAPQKDREFGIRILRMNQEAIKS